MEPRSTEKVELAFCHFPLTALGPGQRIGIWFQGCTIRCRGCMSAHALEFGKGEELTVNDLLDRSAPWLPKCDGVTISGGEPFDQPEALAALLDGLKGRGVRDVLVYSGYSHESLQVRAPRALALLDVLVDGPFRQGEETLAHWKGSENQRLIILSPDPVLHDRYAQYAAGEKARLQVVKHRGGVLVLGVPRQSDTEVIVNGVC